MCTDVWTSCSIQLSVRQGRQHAQGGCALITSTIVKVIFCNGVIQDCDCKGGILKGVFWKETACLSCLLGMFCVQGAGLNLHTRTGTKELWCSGQIQSSAPCCRESYANAAISVVYHGAQLSVCLQSCSSNFPHRCDSVAVRNNLRMQRLILPCSVWGSSPSMGEVAAAETWGIWSHCFHGQETERWTLTFSLLSSLYPLWELSPLAVATHVYGGFPF